MQLSLTECQELRDLLLNDPDVSQSSDHTSDMNFLFDGQHYPSSPTPLLEALENAVSDTISH